MGSDGHQQNSTTKRVIHNFFVLITGTLSIVADIITLASFLRMYSRNVEPWSDSPFLWLALQLLFTLYGNLALAFLFVIAINRIHSRHPYPLGSTDARRTLFIFVGAIWIPSFAAWVVSCLAEAARHGPGTWGRIIFVGLAVLALPFLVLGVRWMALGGALLARTLRPDLPLKIGGSQA